MKPHRPVIHPAPGARYGAHFVGSPMEAKALRWAGFARRSAYQLALARYATATDPRIPAGVGAFAERAEAHAALLRAIDAVIEGVRS